MDENTNSAEWRRVGGKGAVKALTSAKNCRDWELSVGIGKNPETGRYERAYKRVHGCTKTEAYKALDGFKDELRAQFASSTARKEMSHDVEYARLRGELEKQKAALEAAQANVDKYRELLEEKQKAPNCPTIDEYARQWADYRKNTKEVSCATRRNDERNIKLLQKHLGGKRLDEISRGDVKAFYSALMAPGGGISGKALSGTSAQDAAICLTQLYKEAVMDSAVPVDKSPCDGIKLPRIDTQEKEALSDEQVRILTLKCAQGEPDARKVAVMLMLCCGLRRGEACALRWQDIDFEARLVHVRHSYSQARNADGTIEGLKAPKRESSVRAIPMSDGVLGMLKEWRIAQGVYLISLGLPQDGERPVISNQFGGFTRPTNLGKWWDKFSAENGIHATLHQLRHTFATRGVAGGADMITMMHLMGHKNTDMLAKVYAHMDDENMQKAAAMISGDIFDVKPTRIVNLGNEGDVDKQDGIQRTA